MAISHMYVDPITGELKIVLDDKTVSIAGQDGKMFGPNNMIQKTVSEHGSEDEMHIFIRTTYFLNSVIHASSVAIDAEKIRSLQIIVNSYRDRLREMLDCLLYIHEETKRCDKELVVDNGRVSLPQIKKLQEKIENFLLNGKRAAGEIARILGVFFDDSKTGHNYDKHRDWALQRFGSEGNLFKILQDNTSGDCWIKYLVDLRNRIEHPEPNYWVKIANIEYDVPSGKMRPAAWSSDQHAIASDLRLDMEVMINNLLVLSEDLLAACILETLSTPQFVNLVSVPKEQQDPKRPVRFRLNVQGLPGLQHS